MGEIISTLVNSDFMQAFACMDPFFQFSFKKGKNSSRVGGVFVSGNKKYDERISAFWYRYISVYHHIIESGDVDEIGKTIFEIKKISEQVISFLKGEKIDVKNVKLQKWQPVEVEEVYLDSSGNIAGKGKDKDVRVFTLVYNERGVPTGNDLIFYVYDDDELWSALKKLEEERDQKLEKVLAPLEKRKVILEYIQEKEKHQRKVLAKLLKDLLNTFEVHEESKRFLEDLMWLLKAIKNNKEHLYLFLIEVLGSNYDRLKLDLDFVYAERNEDIIENCSEMKDREPLIMLYKPLIQKLGFMLPKRSLEDVVCKIMSKMYGKFRCDKEKWVKESMRKMQKLAENYPDTYGKAYRMLCKMYGENNEEFLRKIRRDLVKILELPTVKKVIFSAPLEQKGFKVERKVLGKKTKILFVVEEGLWEEKKMLVKKFWSLKKEDKDYLNFKEFFDGFWGKNYKNGIIMERLFPDWPLLKKLEGHLIRERKYGPKILNWMMQVSAFGVAIRMHQKKHGKSLIPIFIMKEDDYPLWDVGRGLLNFGLNLPSQTITRKTIIGENGLNKSPDSKNKNPKNKYQKKNCLSDSVVKNTFLSALRQDKKLELKSRFYSDGVFLPNEVFHVLVENKTRSMWESWAGQSEDELIASYRHWMYKVLRIEFNKDDVAINSEGNIVVLANDKGREKLEKFLDEHEKVVIISTDYKSPMKSLWEKRKDVNKYFVIYNELKTPIRRRKKNQGKGQDIDKNAYVISGPQLKKGFGKKTGFIVNKKLSECYHLMIKPPFVVTETEDKKESPYISTSVALFSIFLKGEGDAHTLHRISQVLLNWCIYETESAHYLHSKPKFMPITMPSVLVQRGRCHYAVSLNGLIAELAYLSSFWEETLGVMEP